jgi:starch synthase
MKVLFTASEAYPLLKTGGLGDVVYSLPHALSELGLDVRVLLPGYRDILSQVSDIEIIGWLTVQGADRTHDVRVVSASHPGFDLRLWIIDCAALYDRPGNPYLHPDGYDWPDNAERFAVFSRAAAMLAMDVLESGWRADVVHSHDWQTGLLSAFLAQEAHPPRTVFTIHNLAYGGHFSHDEFTRLKLPGHWWSGEGVEFYGGFSMLKAGLVFSDAITTVSPTYAEEICTPAFGYGMEGILQANSHKLSGILNGVDREVWNPSSDRYLPAHYSAKRRNPGKRNNKAALLGHFCATVNDRLLAAPLLGSVSRLVEQKGIDLVIEAVPELLTRSNANFVFLGSGHHYFENQLVDLSRHYPQRVFTHIGYSEEVAHQIEAGADLFLMPSRFEPCGLNQMYSLLYGTLPVVNSTGGLADTVVDASDENIANGSATGFVMPAPTTQGLIEAIDRALELHAMPRIWNQLQRTAMEQDFGWEKSAMEYILLYENG